jgi:hypothetical protein
MRSFKPQNPNFQKWMALLAVGFIGFGVENAASADPAGLIDDSDKASPVQNYINQTKANQASSGPTLTVEQPNRPQKFQVAAPPNAPAQPQIDPVAEQPLASQKFQVHAANVNPTQLDSVVDAKAVHAAVPLQSTTQASSAPLDEQPQVPNKFRQHKDDSTPAAPQQQVSEPSAYQPAPPQKFQVRAVSDQPAPPQKFQVRAVSDQPAPPRKFQVRAVSDQPPVPAKFSAPPVAQQTEPSQPVAPMSDLPPQPVKFRSSDKGTLIRDDSSVPTPVAPAPPACLPSMVAQNGVVQASNFGKTLNQTLAEAKPQVVPMDDVLERQLDWGGDDHIDALDMARMGMNTKHPMTPLKDGNLSPFVKKLLQAARHEAEQPYRYIGGRKITKPGSKRLCLQGVRMAFQKANGESAKSGWTSRAKDAGPFLKKYGYQKASAGRYNEYNAPVGSVLIYDVPGYPNQAGHIEIKGTDGYYSDFYSPNPVTKALGKRRRLIGVYVPGASNS